jgi:hypothetical protein
MFNWKKYKLGEFTELIKDSTNPTNGKYEEYVGQVHMGYKAVYGSILKIAF